MALSESLARCVTIHQRPAPRLCEHRFTDSEDFHSATSTVGRLNNFLTQLLFRCCSFTPVEDSGTHLRSDVGVEDARWLNLAVAICVACRRNDTLSETEVRNVNSANFGILCSCLNRTWAAGVG